jgi:hypothetical protein
MQLIQMHRLTVPCLVGLALGLSGCSGSSDGAKPAGSGGSTNGGAGGAGVGGSSVGGAGVGASGGNVGAGGSAGGAGAGGSTSGGGGNGGSGPDPIVADCGSLADEGVFEEITPPEVKAGFGQVTDGGGAFAFDVDPVNQGTIYLGTLWQGLWKSTDCGATWTELATGTNGEAASSGMNWTLEVDPMEPEVVYTNSGYSNNHLWKTTNGGTDWEQSWPPVAQPELSAAFQYNFANVVAIDPFDHEHILLTFHEACLAPHTSTCIAESTDAGVSWKLIDGQDGWNGGEGQVIFFLENSQTWLWGSQTNGYFRSGDSGVTWDEIPGMSTTHLQGTQLVQREDGTFFLAGAAGIYRSPDGTASTWELIDGTGPIVGGMVSTGTNLYAGPCYGGGACEHAPLLTSPLSDGNTWTEVESYPDIPQGGNFGYDPGHKLFYSSNMDHGLWRAVMP